MVSQIMPSRFAPLFQFQFQVPTANILSCSFVVASNLHLELELEPVADKLEHGT